MLRGRDHLGAGLELGVVWGEGESTKEGSRLADSSGWTDLHPETYSAVEKRTKGEESEKARTAVTARTVAAIESCIMKCGWSALLVGGVAKMQEVPTVAGAVCWVAVKHGRTFSRGDAPALLLTIGGVPIGNFPSGKHQKTCKCSPNHDPRRTRYSRLRKRGKRYTISKRSLSTEMHVLNTSPDSASASWRGSSRPKKLRRRRSGKQNLQ